MDFLAKPKDNCWSLSMVAKHYLYLCRLYTYGVIRGPSIQ